MVVPEFPITPVMLAVNTGYLEHAVVLLILLSLGLRVIAYRKWFRLYSIGTPVTLIVVRTWALFVGGAQIAA